MGGFGSGVGFLHIFQLAWGPIDCVWRAHNPQGPIRVIDWEQLHKDARARDILRKLLDVWKAALKALEDFWHVISGYETQRCEK
jgi:hypothetical protein